MHNLNINLKKKVMRQVYAIWLFRKISSPIFIEIVILSILVFLASKYIYVFRVMRNAFNATDSVYSLPGFFVRNFMIADAISKLITIGLIITILFFGKDLLKKREAILFH